jgi:hypothetical protein
LDSYNTFYLYNITMKNKISTKYLSFNPYEICAIPN